MFKQPVSVLVVIYSTDGQVLLLERAANPGLWQSVTGSLEPGETPEQAAWRELFEETGLGPSAGSLTNHQTQTTYEIWPQWRHRYAPGVTENTEHFFSFCLPTAQAVQLSPSEHTAQCWLEPETASALCFSPSNRAAILTLPSILAGRPDPGRNGIFVVP